MIEVSIDSQAAANALERLAQSARNPRPALKLIGERLSLSTKERFQNSTGPDGSRWKPNAVATLLGYAGKYSKSFRKDGRISTKGAARIAGKKPLIGETGELSGGINYQMISDGVAVYSPMEYAAIHQFGGQAGRGRKVTIEARPFLGLSAQDETMIESTVENYLRGVLD